MTALAMLALAFSAAPTMPSLRAQGPSASLPSTPVTPDIYSATTHF